MSNKKLYRSTQNKVFCGVCSGLSDYFGIDVTVIRVVWALITVFTALFGGVIGYIICAAIIPEGNGGNPGQKSSGESYAAKPSDEFDSYFKK